MDKDLGVAASRGGIRLGPIIAGIVLVSAVWTGARIYLEREAGARPVPPFAGRVCDEVWQETRHGNPTLAWFRSCVTYAAEVYERETQKPGDHLKDKSE